MDVPDLSDGFALFHWAPARARAQIERYGIRVSMWSSGRQWRPPYSCWADDPSLAWVLIAELHPDVAEWDLWMTYSDVPAGAEALVDFDGTEHFVKEWRIYERVYKRDLWWVGSRTRKATGVA